MLSHNSRTTEDSAAIVEWVDIIHSVLRRDMERTQGGHAIKTR